MTTSGLSIVHFISSLGIGGMERFVLRLANAQQQAGHRVRILALRGGPLQEDAAREHLETAVLGGSRVGRIFEAVRLVRGWRPDVIHAHNPTSVHYATVCSVLSSARVILTDHSQALAPPRLPGAWECRRIETVVAVSAATASNPLVPALASKTIVILNGVSPAPPVSRTVRDDVRRELGLGERFVGLALARLTPIKGHAHVITAAARLHAAGIPITILAAGDGPLLSELEHQASALGVADAIRFLGFRSDIPDLMAAADFLVLPSLSEGLPLALLEAMTAGLPVIASEVGGIPEVIQHGVTGLLCPPASPERLTEEIARLYEDPALREGLAAKAKRFADSTLSFDGMCRKYEGVYREALEGQRGVNRAA